MKKQILWILAVFFFLNSAGQVALVAKTPPMGWNSWDCFGMDVNEEQMKATADYMAKNMKRYGWEYIVLDMGWNYGEGLDTWNFRMKSPPQVMDEYGRLIPNSRKFPSASGGNGLKPLADHVHGLGLKFGIHIMRGIPWQAVEKNTPIKGTPYKAKDIASSVDACPWFHGMVTVDMTKPGSQEYYDSLIEMYQEWGVDYIKADDLLNNPYHRLEIEAIQKAIQKAGRKIVLSLSAGPLEVKEAHHLQKHANLWRISGDMWDDWSYIQKTFEYCRTWQYYVMPNNWPDCDMLPLGRLRINGTDGALAKAINVQPETTVNEEARLTDDEKYSLVTLWTIFRSPLMMGGDLLQMDKLTKHLLTNKEVISVNQNTTNNREIRATENESIWVADDPVTGGKYLAMFNTGADQQALVNVTFQELGITGKHKVRDLWSKKNLGKFRDSFESSVNSHGCKLYKITPLSD
ncbi:MAG TPA: glycoside hydrolase family 27 protein [Prolixibacteraceae bacterium]|nr:glycoside hydrolase family 27 protein [Prolixibacteraceae bacterium]